jgi:thioredoxin reductase (NADPH)
LSERFDVAVAGGGIAGLTAGLTCARLGRKTLVLAGDLMGGLLLSIERIDGFPGFPEGVAGYDLCPMVQEQAAGAGAEFAPVELRALDAQGGSWRIATSGDEYEAGAVILATGAGLRSLGVPGEERLRGKGVSHCASCDGPLMRDRTVAVIGGGDSAAQEALTLAQFAGRVIVLHRGDALTAQETYRERIAGDRKIKLRCNVEVTEFVGETTLTGLRTRATDGANADLDATGAFVYVGLAPNAGYLNGSIALDSGGRIPTDGAMRTRLPGVFAAGAVRSGWLGRAAISAGEGAAAALGAHRYLQGSKRWLES